MPSVRASHLAHNTDQIHEKQNNPTSESRASHETARVSANPKQQRVLPTWCCRARPGQPIDTTVVYHYSGKKWIAATLEIHLDLPSKRQLVLQDDGSESFKLVEADHQPHQEQ